MGGSGQNYKGGLKLTSEDIKRRHKKLDGDAYIFDVEYEKLKKEQERLEREYEHEREEYLRISEELRREMMNGTATEQDMTRFMAALTDKGVMLEQQQQKMQKEIDDLANQRADIDQQMNELRKKAFSGSTSAYQAVDRDTDYKGFKLDNTNQINYGNAKIVEMSPQEYLRRVAFDVKGNGMRDLVENMSPSNVDKLARQMLRGIRFSAPSLNYRANSTKGDERALAALLNGVGRIPVMIIE